MAAKFGKEYLPTKLHHYGKIFTEYIMDEKSSLHPQQRDALKNLVAWFSKEDTQNLTAVIVMPTGTGKTGVMCCLPYIIGGAIQDQKISQINFSKPILIISPCLTIQDQLKKSFSPRGFLWDRGIIGKNDLDHDVLYTVHVIESRKAVMDLTGYEANIIISNAQKWRKNKDGTPTYEDILDSDLFSMVFVDEAHHLPACQWKGIVDKFHNAKMVFFTATPDRADGQKITTGIEKIGYAYELSRKEAIEKGIIRDVHFEELPMQAELEPPPPKRICSANTRLVLAKLKERLDNKNTKPLPGDKKHAAIVIVKNIDEADATKEICIDSLEIPEDKVKVVHSAKHKTANDKKKVIEMIKEGNFEVVIVVQMLLEGFDYPPLSIAGILRSIRSPVTFAQFIGRVQRRVNHKNEDGTTTWEDGVVADVITHPYFKQKKMYDDYINPTINESDENKDLDADEIAKPEKNIKDEDKTVKAEENIDGAVKAEKTPMSDED